MNVRATFPCCCVLLILACGSSEGTFVDADAGSGQGGSGGSAPGTTGSAGTAGASGSSGNSGSSGGSGGSSGGRGGSGGEAGAAGSSGAGSGGSAQRDGSVTDARVDAPSRMCSAKGAHCERSSECCSGLCSRQDSDHTCSGEPPPGCTTPCGPGTYCRPAWLDGMRVDNTCEPVPAPGCANNSADAPCDRCLKLECPEELVAFRCSLPCIGTYSCFENPDRGGVSEYDNLRLCQAWNCEMECFHR